MTAPARSMSARSKPYADYNTKTRPCLRCGITPGPHGFRTGVCKDCTPYGPVIEVRR
jgi:hypothetical protein